MILTEEEAKTKRCQEGFGPGLMGDGRVHMASFGGTAYPQAQVTSPACCMGSGCMAWRWDQWDVDSTTHERISGKTGHCGKAGRP